VIYTYDDVCIDSVALFLSSCSSSLYPSASYPLSLVLTCVSMRVRRHQIRACFCLDQKCPVITSDSSFRFLTLLVSPRNEELASSRKSSRTGSRVQGRLTSRVPAQNRAVQIMRASLSNSKHNGRQSNRTKKTRSLSHALVNTYQEHAHSHTCADSLTRIIAPAQSQTQGHMPKP